MKLSLTLSMVAMLALSSAATGQGKPAKPAGWQTWTWNDTCYAFLAPASESVAAIDHEGAYLSIKHMPAEETFDAVAIVSGHGASSGYVGRIDIDGQIFGLLPFQGAGFVSTGEREERLLAALLSGTEARVTWTSDSGMIIQNYVLKGLSTAKRVIDVACKEARPQS